ncbi:MAG: riboflavin synthase [Kiritimatiellae bacterium]|nr:riboflavin synthase [Kiritimatiellia bacterium]
MTETVMFTGIVQRRGRIVERKLDSAWGRIVVDAGEWDRPVEIGESVAISGVCLTVKTVDGTLLGFDVLAETCRRTNLAVDTAQGRVNIERALRWGDPLGGHIVTGHVDGVGRVGSIEPVGRDWRFEIACAPELMDGMVFKGSVAVDGVSLTIAELTDTSIAVHIIPHTYEVTCFGLYQVGDLVNIEVDVLGKFVRRFVERGVAFPSLTWEELRRQGLLTDAEGEH